MRARFRSLAIDTLATLARPFLKGVGCVVCLHRVLPEAERSPLPCNRALELSTEGLRAVLKWVRERGLEPIAMDDVPARLQKRQGAKFIAFTLDDGYRDNAVHALPIFQEFAVPFTVNVTTGFLTGEAHPWWYVVEKVVSGRTTLEVPWLDGEGKFSLPTNQDRSAAVELISDRLRALPHPDRMRRLAELCEAGGIDAAAVTRKLIMSSAELRVFAAEPLVSIGAHAVTHSPLTQLNEREALIELTESREALRAAIGKEPTHFAFPFGGPAAATELEFALAKRAGFLTAVTTRSGNLRCGHSDHLHSLPRIGISGNFDTVPRIRRLESGLRL